MKDGRPPQDMIIFAISVMGYIVKVTSQMMSLTPFLYRIILLHRMKRDLFLMKTT